MKQMFLSIFCLALLVPGVSLAANSDNPGASGASTQLSVCLLNSLNGAQRTEFAKWIFFSMAVHPSLNDYSTVTAADRDHVNKKVGHLLTTLLAVDCARQLKTATQSNPRAVVVAFKRVGAAAMRELMSDPGVKSAMTAYAQYLDRAKIRAAAGE